MIIEPYFAIPITKTNIKQNNNSLDIQEGMIEKMLKVYKNDYAYDH